MEKVHEKKALKGVQKGIGKVHGNARIRLRLPHRYKLAGKNQLMDIFSSEILSFATRQRMELKQTGAERSGHNYTSRRKLAPTCLAWLRAAPGSAACAWADVDLHRISPVGPNGRTDGRTDGLFINSCARGIDGHGEPSLSLSLSF